MEEIGSGQNTPVTIPLGKILPNPRQPRKEFTEESLDELAESIRQHGIIQPILVEMHGPDQYMIVAGERRWRAAQKAGLREAPVIVKNFTEQERLEIALIENIQREDLNAIDEANAYKNLMEVTGLGQEEIAKRVGKNRSTVANALRLLKLPPEVQTALRQGQLSAGHARTVLAVVNPADQVLLFNRIMDNGLSVRQAEEMSKDLNAGKRSTSAPLENPIKSPNGKPPEIEAAEQRLITALGTKVTISGDGKKGKVTIEYYSTDDLERLLELVSKQ
jgi:ParB family chromosome partitioning protein